MTVSHRARSLSALLLVALLSSAFVVPQAHAAIYNVVFKVAGGSMVIEDTTADFPAGAKFTGSWNDKTEALTGTLTVPPGQVEASGLTINVTITQIGGIAGTLDKQTGGARVPVSLRVGLQHNLLPEDCRISPIDVVLKTGGNGVPLNFSSGAMKLAAAGFNVPASSGCGAFATAIDNEVGLPTSDTTALLQMEQVAKPPSRPQNVNATGKDHAARVRWTAPSSSGGALITKYQAVAVPGGKSCTSTTATTCVVDGLRNDTKYQFKVKARNFAGWGPFSALSSKVQPG